MAVQTINGSYSIEGAVQALTELLAGNVGTAAKLHLYTDGLSPTRNSVYADFLASEASFTGYSAVAVTWGSVGVDAGGQATSLSNRALFACSASGTPQVIAGAWLSCQSAAGPPAVNEVLSYVPFPVPITIAMPLQFIGVVWALQQPTLQGYAIIDN